MEPVAGIFVGGRASRMGGVAKGLLVSPDGEPIVLRTRRLLERAGARCVLVGRHPAYASLGLDALGDDAGAEGPLAGLLALLEHARGGLALAVACDMPYVTSDLVARLLEAPPAPIVAPRRLVRKDGTTRELFEPLFARHDAARVLPLARAFASAGGRKLQLLFEAAGACPLELEPGSLDALRDWDEPSDLQKPAPRGRQGR